jgi:hypothetical protein
MSSGVILQGLLADHERPADLQLRKVLREALKTSPSENDLFGTCK